jgi:Bacterial virulence protein (VirJ)
VKAGPVALSVLLACLGAAACAPAINRSAPRPIDSVTTVVLHGHALRLHVSMPPATAPRSPVLLVYATGDAGWWGKDRDMYSHLSTWGYPAVGFSAREYVHHLGGKETVRPREVAADFAAILGRAEAALGLPHSTRAVLVGKSRGAGLAVAAAGPTLLKPQLAGVLAVGLTREEEYVRRRLLRSRPLVMLETYSYLPQLGDVPVALIQSTRDGYVPAEEARQLFGPDTASRELIAIAASDHNFGGALDVLYERMQESLRWIIDRQPLDAR